MQTYAAYFFVFVFVAFICCVAILFPLLLEELSRANERRKFRVALSKAITSGPLSWKLVRILADRYHLTQRGLSLCLTRLIADALEGKDGLATQQAASFEAHYDQVQKDEPFDGIPNDVRFHLERVREKLGEGDDLLRPLAKQLQDLSTRNKAKERNMWIISVLSLLAGVIGAILGVVPLLEKPKDTGSIPTSILIAPEHTTSKDGLEPSSEPAKKW